MVLIGGFAVVVVVNGVPLTRKNVCNFCGVVLGSVVLGGTVVVGTVVVLIFLVVVTSVGFWVWNYALYLLFPY